MSPATPRLPDGMRLVATRSAINCAGLFVVSTLTKWGVRSILRDAVLETEALVTAAVNATGIPQERVYWTELTVSSTSPYSFMALMRASRIEVWDSAPNPPLLSDEADSPVKRGYYPTPRGKVVWAELPVLPRRRSGAPRTHPKPSAEQFGHGQETELLRRMREGLDEL